MLLCAPVTSLIFFVYYISLLENPKFIKVEKFKPLDRVFLDPEASLHPFDDQVSGG
jgi:hypothetical protein